MSELTKRRDEMAAKRASHQCTTGQDDLDKAVFWYLRIGFEDGFDAATKEWLKIVGPLLEVLEALSKVNYDRDAKNDYNDGYDDARKLCSEICREALTNYREMIE